ncbi:metallophosphoesterase [Maribacter polysiphoniae]|uniref:metallophosphoesterase n=1 Tax=Maribacter polysiphoniae TaxID=429344 RepID=UPI00235259B6|nr:metallophosphoesterase [Maribacter polysiphoniae]
MILRKVIFVFFIISFLGCKEEQKSSVKELQVAFMSDVHLQDIYGSFKDNDYKGILNPQTGKYTLARTMQSQLQSTRLFNENYFAFLAALDDVVKRGVKLVVLPGDFSDDGQAFNIRGLRHVLDNYTKNYGIRFILTTGNHDPVRPIRMAAGKTDFLGKNGHSQAIFSEKGMFLPKNHDDLPVIITQDIAKLGYVGILDELQDFGFFPKPNDRYWESPFSSYGYENYDFNEAKKQATFENRKYRSNKNEPEIPDVSYLVEPIEDVWFLAIDANIYVPKPEADADTVDPRLFSSASIGYNNLLLHKAHLMDWIKSVTTRAEELGKTLIVFSHYPMLDFYDGAGPDIEALFGTNKMQMHRMPSEEISQMLIEAGVKVHFGGHMHMNDTGQRHLESGSLINIQIPSMAAYVPGYKLLTLKDNDVFEIETVVIDNVPDFDSLFPLYEKEYGYLEQFKDSALWDKGILEAKTYKEFTTWHLNELVRLRFLKEDWPENLKFLLIRSSGEDLLRLAFDQEEEYNAFYKRLQEKNTEMAPLDSWTGLHMIHDFYKIRNADELAFYDIDQKRLEGYKVVCQQLRKSNYKNLRLWASIFMKVCNGEPSDHFKIDLKTGKIERVVP